MAQSSSAASKYLKIGLVIAVAGVAIAAVMFWFHPLSKITEKQTAHAETTHKVAPKPRFMTLKPFTVNIQGGRFDGRLLYVAITLQLGDKATGNFLHEHLPQVRNRLLQVLSGQHAEKLVTSDGKKALATQIRKALIDAPFATGDDPLTVQHVLFTQFIVQ